MNRNISPFEKKNSPPQIQTQDLAVLDVFVTFRICGPGTQSNSNSSLNEVPLKKKSLEESCEQSCLREKNLVPDRKTRAYRKNRNVLRVLIARIKTLSAIWTKIRIDSVEQVVDPKKPIFRFDNAC